MSDSNRLSPKRSPQRPHARLAPQRAEDEGEDDRLRRPSREKDLTSPYRNTGALGQ